MAEALAQRNGIIGYFRGILHFSVTTHPFTYYLAAAALRIGQFQCMHYKGVFNRPRPVRLFPELMPPIEPPGHSAFPSGHSTQSFLIARCLETVVPVAIGAPSGGKPSPYARLAERLAKNREVLGVHYPSDTAAGMKLAEGCFKLMLQCPSIAGSGGAVADTIDDASIYANGWIAQARKEWEPRR
jgi:membrane-associated phospholipid phosphatase